MVEIERAKQLIRESVGKLVVEKVALSKALNRVLGEDIVASISLPPFRQSAMDGYAIHIHEDNSYRKGEVVQAGDSLPKDLEPKTAARVFTGAPIPANANCVVMQEHVEVIGDRINLTKVVNLNDHIREIGEQIKAGDVALEQGTLLTPAGLGFLQSFGITELEVYSKPEIALIVSGNELAKPGSNLKGGEIYESNSITLGSALIQAGFNFPKVGFVEDNLEATINKFEEALNQNNVLLVSGGISVGDYDFAKKAFEHLGVQEVFYKVKQKPGKPLYFGMLGENLVFGLPGNPASALICLYEYVLPALKLMAGYQEIEPRKIFLPLSAPFVKKGNRALFAKAITSSDGVTILDGQQSSMLHTFSIANALAFIPEEVTELKVGESVEVHLI